MQDSTQDLGAQFTVSGAYTGQVFAVRVDLETAARDAMNYSPHGYDALAAMLPGEVWRSHPDGRGIIIRRVA